MDDRVNLPDGSWLGYQTSGHGPCHLVLLHGFAANMGTWHDLTPFFTADRYTLHLLDLPAHGTASRNKQTDYSIPAQAERLAVFLETRSLQNVTLIGHSMGGAIALALAIHNLEFGINRLNRMILIDAPAYPQPLPQFIELLTLPLLGPLMLRLLSPTTIVRHGLQAVLSDHNLITADRIERYASPFRASGAATALSRCARQLLPPNAARLTASYQHLSLPTLLIWGEQDRIVRLYQAEHLAQDLPNCTLETLPLCGHNPHEDNPAKTFDIIERFLTNNPIDS